MTKGITTQRIMILFAIACGSLSAGLIYKAYQLPDAQLTDDQAKKQGYFSPEDERETTAAFKEYWPAIIGAGRLDESHYKMAAEVLRSGSKAARVRIIVIMGYLRGEAARLRGLTLMPTGEMTKGDYGLWRVTIKRWLLDTKGEAVYSLLVKSGNPNAARIAEDLRSAEDAKS